MRTLHCLPILAVALLTGCRSPGVIIRDLRDCARVSVAYGVGLEAHVRVGDITCPAIGSRTKTTRYGFEDRFIMGRWESDEQPFPAYQIAERARKLKTKQPEEGPSAERLREKIRSREGDKNWIMATLEGAGDLALGAIGMVLGFERSYLRKDKHETDRVRGVVYRTVRQKSGYWHPFHSRAGWEAESPFNTALDIEVGVTAGVVSARVGVNPLEILDFAFGFLWWDIAKDDDKKVDRPFADQ